MAASGGSGRAADILAYWHAVELFDPQDLPRSRRVSGLTRKPGTRCEEAISVANGEPLPLLPWQPGHLRYGEPPETSWFGSVWRHTVYGGLFSVRDVRAALVQALGKAAGEDYAGTHDTEGALFAFTVDDQGALIEDTAAISSCAWATGRLHHPGPGAPDWLDGFGSVTGECVQALHRLLARPVSYLPPPPGVPSGEAGGWRVTVTDILGGAAGGAVAALLGMAAPVIGGVVSAGALTGAAGAVINRATQRAEQREQAQGRTSPAPERPSALARERASAPAPAMDPGSGSSPDHTPRPGPDPDSGSGPDHDLVPAAAFRRSVQVPDVVAFAVHVADLLGLPPGIANELELRIVSVPVRRRRDGSLPDPEPVFLSSAVAPDLARIKDAGQLSPPLASYLSDPLPPGQRIDLRHERETVLNGVHPDAFPLARWPTDTSKPLAVSQQFAVDKILAELAEGGLFSVNGPPGTGKTTLLRDLIAAIVVQRAGVLADLPSPKAAFSGKPHTWMASEGQSRVVRKLDARLTGFEIVVASANNNAVENVTKELPALSAIDERWRDEADYFSEQATVFLGEPAWGMIAAPLGNAEKRADFRKNFWFGDSGMEALLKQMERDRPAAGEWRAAVQRFIDAREAAAELARDRAEAASYLRSPITDAAVQAARNAAEQAVQELGRAEAEREHADGSAVGLLRAVRVLSGQFAGHERSRPRGLRGLLGLGRDVAAWKRQRAELADQLGRRKGELREAQQEADRLTAQVVQARQRASDAGRAAEELLARQVTAELRIRQARERWDAAFPEDWLGRAEDQQELSAPWSDEEWTTARTQVFLAALDLHRAFIAGAAGTIRRNLRQLVAALGREPGAPGPKAELIAWQTLFLLVPVISTTFASCGRMFGALDAGSLGWVLVDEAGQALPQHAAGALWRARRAVIVGDPLQLEPISRVPAEVQDRLRTLFGVDHGWLPAGASAQGVADRRNRWGTQIVTENRDGDPGQVWVGAPLRVHRRCEQPMFLISNTISYQGLMVYGTSARPFPGGTRPDYPPSSWIDVTGPEIGKWVPAQGEALCGVLRRLHIDNGVSLDHIYVLSPFRDVVTACQSLARTELNWKDFADRHIGTVHTMQGKEADVVVLVLGTDPNPAKKARDWAARPANLLNVAVSRARRRLFIIGGHAEWGAAANFSVPARVLPRHSWPPAGR